MIWLENVSELRFVELFQKFDLELMLLFQVVWLLTVIRPVVDFLQICFLVKDILHNNENIENTFTNQV